MQKGVIITLLLFVCLYVPINAAVSKDISRSNVKIHADSNLLLAKADSLYQMQNYPEAAVTYELLLNDPELYHIPVLKKLAFCYAGLNNPNRSISYIDAYFLAEFDTTILMDDAFDPKRIQGI